MAKYRPDRARVIINRPTLIPLAMLPVLFWVYDRLARMEEADALAEFDESYRQDMIRTGMFLPKLS